MPPEKESKILNYVRKQATLAQKGMTFPTHNAKRLDILKREVDIHSVQLGLTLM